MKDDVINLRVTKSAKKHLAKLAKAERRTLSQFMRGQIDDLIARALQKLKK